MAIIEDARSNDAKGNIENAFELYLQAISEGEAEIEDYLNASFLAFIFQDFGVSNEKKIPDRLVDKAWQEMYNLLDKCETRFGKQIEIDFWRRYYKLILEQQNNNELCHKYLSSLPIIENPITEKDRYINSLLESSSFQRESEKSK